MTMFRVIVSLACVLAVCMGVAAAGEPEKPLVFVFQKQKDPTAIKEKADEVAAFVSREVGRPVQAFVPTDYAASVQALVSGRADFAYVSAIPFLLARRDGGASLLLAEVRPDLSGAMRTRYDSVFVAAAEGGVKSVADMTARVRELRIAFTSTTSTSGYVMPYWRLVREGVLEPRQDPKAVFRGVGFGGSYTLALEQVLAGRADVACVSAYTVEGPTADAYTTSEQRAKLAIIGRTPDVPTHLVAVGKGVSPELREKVKAALMKLAAEKPELLKAVYGAAAFAEVNEDEHVKPVVEALEALGQPIEGFAR